MSVPVVVNGTEISERAIKAEIQHHPAPSFEEARHAAVRALVIRELLLQAADHLGIADVEPVVDPDTGRRETREEAVIRALLEQEVKVPEPDEAACRRYYESNRRRFRSPDLFEAAHILFPAAPGDEAARAAARHAAAALIGELQQKPESFAAAAALHSACPSAQQGGNLGQIGPGQTVAEFEAALRAMVPGAMHGEPVETRYGFHIVRLDRRIDGEMLPFDLVRVRIADYLDEAVHRRALQQYLSILAGRAQVTGVDLGAANGPLVQ